MKLPQHLTTVTPASKALAMVIFIIFPFLSFILGMKYQKLISPVQSCPVNINNNSNMPWKKTEVVGRGIVFEYPSGWHLAGGTEIGGDDLGQEENYDGYLLSHEPIVLSTGEGSIADIIISVKNGSKDPSAKFTNKLSEIKQNLIDIKEEKLPSDYFNPIYHITGKIGGNGWGAGNKVEKYVFLSTNTKYASSELFNRNIIVIDIRGRDDIVSSMLDRFISSFKECHYTYCNDIFE